MLEEELCPIMQQCVAPLLSRNTCRFWSVHDIFEDSDIYYRDVMNQPDLESKIWHVWSLPLKSHAWCITHNQLCPIRTGATTRVGGPPCPDWSSANQRSNDQKGLLGPSLPTVLSFGRKTDYCETTLVCLENVRRFANALPPKTFGPHYQWGSAAVEPSMVGFNFISRPRKSESELMQKRLQGPLQVGC